jgi:hypothetical protein
MRYARLLASLLLIFILLAVGSQLLRHVLPTSGSRKAAGSAPAGLGAGTRGVATRGALLIAVTVRDGSSMGAPGGGGRARCAGRRPLPCPAR